MDIFVENLVPLRKFCQILLNRYTIPNKQDFLDEVIQDGYIKYHNWVTGPKYVKTEGKEMGLLISVLRSVLLNKLRERNKIRAGDHNWDLIAQSNGFEPSVEQDMDRQILTDIISTMKGDEILAFDLNKQGYRDFEVKHKLKRPNITDSTARVLVNQGKNKVKKLKKIL
jgi:hypothetical protein